MSQTRPDRLVRRHRRPFLAYVLVRLLVLSLFVAAGTPNAAAEGGGTTGTLMVAQTTLGEITLGATVQVYAVTLGEDGRVPTGTITFSVCPPGTHDGTGCTGGHPFGTVPVDTGGTAFSPPYRPSEGGQWCFRADYSGDAALAPATYSGPSTCTNVLRAASAMVLTADQSSLPHDDAASATAVVHGVPGGPAPTGPVRFEACPADATTGTCTATYGPIGAGTLVAQSVQTSTATSPGFDAPGPGTWCFRAFYDGDAGHTGSFDEGTCYVATAPPPGESGTGNGTDDGTAGNGTEDGTAGNGTDDGAPDDGPAPPGPAAPRGLGWYRQHGWAVTDLTLAGTTYDEVTLRIILDGPIKGDAGKLLARHLIVAKLNQAAGAAGPDADDAIAEADAFLASLGGPDGGARMAKGVGDEVGRLIARMEGSSESHTT